MKNVLLIVVLAVGMMATTHAQSSRTKDFTSTFKVGYALGVGDFEEVDYINVTYYLHHNFNQFLAVGIGTGIRRYTDPGNSFFPLLVQFKTTPVDANISPLITIDGGYTFGTTDQILENLGWLVHPAVGIVIGANKTDISIAIGYSLQWFDTISYDPNYSTGVDAIEAVTFALGITF